MTTLLSTATLKEKATLIRLVIFDVDGVLTDGRIYITAEGQEYKVFHARDGMGITLLQRAGIQVGIITGRESTAVTHRMKELGVKHVFQGQLDKRLVLENLCSTLELTWEQVAYLGDDVNDIPVMQQVGLAIAVADAHPSTLCYAHWQTQLAGGCGAAREVCDLIMEARKN